MEPNDRDPHNEPVKWHAERVDAVLERFGSDSEAGLSADEARRRLQQYGTNELPKERRAGLVAIFLRQFTDPLIYILLTAAAVSLAIGNASNAVFISLVLLLNALVGTFQDYKAESSARALQEKIRVRPRVVRNGKHEEIDGSELVPGDIVLLETGDAVAADIRLIESSSLRADESLLTGESTPVEKDAGAELNTDAAIGDRANMLHAGSAVIGGRATGIVVHSGTATEIGHIAESLTDATGGTPPLVLKLKRMTRWIGILTLGAITVLATIQLLQGVEPTQIFTLAVALAVAAIPAGLPVAITVALSVTSSRMADRNVIVRRLPAVEGLGSCTLIASDKTGTLTANQLTVRQVWLGQNSLTEISGEGLSVKGNVTTNGDELDDASRQQLQRFATAAALANEGEFTIENGEVVDSHGDSTDLAFLVLAQKAGLDQDELQRNYPVSERIPFDPAALFSATFNDYDGRLIAHVKGAPERVMEMCTGTSLDSESTIDFDAVREQQHIWTEQGFRLLAAAAGEVKTAERDALSGLQFLGLAALIDPVRDEVPAAIERCHNAGVGVRMITGDHPGTALAIGRELNLAENEDEVLSGSVLTEAGEQGSEKIERARVFARVEPLQKTEIVDALQEAGEFVAVTGDGVNDAPALRRANIGIAMGKDGTDVARNTADLILTDDNFASIVAGIEEGRVAYDNVRKVVWLLLATGAAEVLLFFLALGFGLPMPLTAVQLLWLNLVTNGIQDVALAFEKAEPDVLDRPPRPPDEPVFDRRMIEQVVLSGAYIGVVAFIVYFYLNQAMGMAESEARNMTLLLMVLFENIHVFSCRSERRSLFSVPIRNNPLLIGAVILAQGVHVAAMFTPGLSKVLDIQPVASRSWIILLGIAATLLLIDESAKLIKKRLENRHDWRTT